MTELIAEGAADTNKLITDHPFRSKTEEPWGLCRYLYHNGLKNGKRCNLAESAHADTVAKYKTVENYWCPDCVTKRDMGRDPGTCVHAPELWMEKIE